MNPKTASSLPPQFAPSQPPSLSPLTHHQATLTQTTVHIAHVLEQLPRGPTSHLGPIHALGEPGNGDRSRSADSSWLRRAPAPSDVSWGQLACLVRPAARILLRHTPLEQMILLLKARRFPPSPSPPPLLPLPPSSALPSRPARPHLHHQHDELVGLGKAVWPGPAVVRSSGETRPIEAGFILMYDWPPSPTSLATPLVPLLHPHPAPCHLTPAGPPHFSWPSTEQPSFRDTKADPIS